MSHIPTSLITGVIRIWSGGESLPHMTSEGSLIAMQGSCAIPKTTENEQYRGRKSRLTLCCCEFRPLSGSLWALSEVTCKLCIRTVSMTFSAIWEPARSGCTHGQSGRLQPARDGLSGHNMSVTVADKRCCSLRCVLTVATAVTCVLVIWGLLPDTSQNCRSRTEDADRRIADRLHQRRLRIKRACRKYGEILPWQPRNAAAREDVVMGQVLWRVMPKSGSTFLDNVFVRKLYNDPHYQCEVTECHEIIHQYKKAYQSGAKWEEKITDILQKDTPFGEGGSLIVVRDPRARLASAYFGLVVPDSEGYGKAIMSILGKADQYDTPTFSDFVNYLIWTDAELLAMNPHFMPQEMHAWLCNADFQYIVQLEKIGEELDYVTRALGLSQYAAEPIKHRNTANYSGVSVEQLYKQLTTEQRNALNDIYRLDILLFHH